MKHIHGGNVYRNSGMIDFSANINFLGMPDGIKQAALRGIEESFHYPEPESETLANAISDYYRLDNDKVVVGNGAAEVIFALASALKPQKALMVAPTFYEYEQALNTVNCAIERYYIITEEIKIDFLEKIDHKTDIVFICNPNNPTGSLTSKELLLQILAKSESVNATLVVDESFLDFSEDCETLTMIHEISKHSNLVVIKSFTKIFAMPGIRLGFALCGNNSLVAGMKERLQPWNVSLPAQYAGIAAIKELTDMSFITATREAVKKERTYLLRELADMGFTAYESAANFILLEGSTELGEFCKSRGVLIRDCSNFEGLGKGWFRIAVRSHEENERLIGILRDKVN